MGWVRSLAWLLTLIAVLALGVITGGAQGSRTRGVQVAAASDLKFALDEMLEAPCLPSASPAGYCLSNQVVSKRIFNP
jgi:hypothetical protein